MVSGSNIDPSLPFIDLHRHIDGSVRLSTILELGKKHGVPTPTHAFMYATLKPYIMGKPA